MKGMNRRLLGLAIMIAAAFATPVQAVDPIEDSRIDTIRANCVFSQGALQRVLVSDRVTRINRARAYDDTLKLLAAFNSRASLNTYNVSELVEATSTLESQVASFKNAYKDYEQKLLVVMDMDCKSEPAEFYNNLQRARSAREGLQATIVAIDKKLTDYKAALQKVAPLFNKTDPGADS